MALLGSLCSSRGMYDYVDLGARKILTNYTGLEQSKCERICISHGVDFGHFKRPQDLNTPLPIHWAYNDSISLRLGNIKTCFKMAHPWLFIAHDYQPRRNSVLLLGPSPGPKNNAAVENRLKELNIKQYDILIKKRGDISDDLNYWTERGVGVFTAGDSDQDFLFRLSSIMSKYETIIGFTPSSALVFAATLGLTVKLFSCPLYSYETLDYGDLLKNGKVMSYGGSLNKFTQFAFNGELDEVRRISKELLGGNLIKTPDEAREAIIAANVFADENPIFVDPDLRFHKTRISAALLFKRKGLLTQKLFIKPITTQLIKKKQYVTSLMTNDVDIAFNGMNGDNIQMVKVEYKRHLTEPGMGQ